MNDRIPPLPQGLLAELQATLGPDFVLDNDGHCALTVDGALTWHWQTGPDGARALLFARLTQCPPDQAQGLALMMLAANLPGAGLDGAALGYSASQELAGLSLTLSLADPATAVVARVLAFVDQASAWRAHLTEWQGEASASTPPLAAAPASAADLGAAVWLNQRA